MQNDQDTLIPSAQVRARYGNVSHMWIVRRLADDPEFPKPIYIGKRRFWRVSELAAWEKKLAVRQWAAWEKKLAVRS